MSHGNRILCLDGVRALSIMLVLLAHMAPLGPKVLALNEMSARLGMSLFFCMSGYLITSILYRNPNVFDFLVKRVLRIVPALAVYLLILTIVVGISPRTVILNLTFVSNYLTIGLSEGPVGHLWSLAVEMHFYLAVSLAVGLFGRRALWAIPLAALIVTGLRIQAGAEISINTHLRVDEILTGGCLALATLAAQERLRAFLAPRGRAIALVAVVALLWAASGHEHGGAMNYARPYLAATLVGLIMHSDLPLLRRPLESGPARYVARISYALYIYHPLMIFGVMNTGSTLERYLLKRPVSIALTWAAAYLSTTQWEERWQGWARQFLQNRTRTRAGQTEA